MLTIINNPDAGISLIRGVQVILFCWFDCRKAPRLHSMARNIMVISFTVVTVIIVNTAFAE